MPMATKLGRMVIYLERLLPIKSHDHIITWSWKITWETKNISLLPQCLWAQNLAGWWLTLRSSYPCYFTLWSSGIGKLRDKLKSLYLHYHNVFGHKTWQDGDLPWAWQKRRGWGGGGWGGVFLKRGWYPNAHYELLLIKSHNHIITWSWETTWQTKNISPLPQYLWSQNLAQRWLTLSDFYPLRYMAI